MKIRIILPLLLMSLVSFPSWADHIKPILNLDKLDQKPYNERCVVNGLFGVAADCLCEKLTDGVCMKYASEAKYKSKLLKDLHDGDITKQAREKLFNKCMFKNIKPNSNAAHRRIVKNYCNDQAGE